MTSRSFHWGYWTRLIFVFLGLLGLCSCEKNDNSRVQSVFRRHGHFRVAMILPGSRNDHSFSEQGYRGLCLIEKKLGAEVVCMENVTVSIAEEILKKFSSEEYDLVIAYGGEFVSAVERVALMFPRVKYVAIGLNGGNNRNLGAMTLQCEDSGFLAGVLASLTTKSHKIACLMGDDTLPNMKLCARGMAHGVQYIDPSIQIHLRGLQTWTDEEKAEKIALQEIQNGVDVLIVMADSASRSIHRVAEHKGIYTIGWVADEYSLAPKAVITSFIESYQDLIFEGAQLACQGRLEGIQYRMGFREGVLKIAPFRNSLDAPKKQKFQQIFHDLISGKIDPLP